MMEMRWYPDAFLLVALLMGLSGVAAGQTLHRVTAPGGGPSVSLQAAGEGMRYEVTYKHRAVVLPSVIRLEMDAPASLFRNLEVLGVERRTVDTTWIPVYGERSLIRDRYNEMTLSLRNRADTLRSFRLLVRAYDAGVAFAVHFPEQQGLSTIAIADEATTFAFPEGARAWFTPVAQAEYRLLPLDRWPSEAERPLTVQLPDGLYATVTEAAMVNYARMKLALAAPGVLVTRLASPVTEGAPFTTPWRVVMVGEKPGDLLEANDLILNLNQPSRLLSTDWIKPGKVIREVTLSTEGARTCVDFAVAHNLQYIHFDAGWYGHEYSVASDASTVTVDPLRNPKGDLDLGEAVRYARENGIGVLLYVNRRALERQLDVLLPLYRAWGISGMKFGFVQVGSHRWTTWLHEAVRKAADYGMMVNVHDEYRPTGFSRTYPNLMTQEGILGNEAMPDATHNTILPFTRFLAGAADYTFCYYQRPEFREASRYIKTTPAHQLALPVVFYSPLQWLFWYDRPEDYQGEPEIAFWDALPTVWDESRVVTGEIGGYAAIARRSGADWFLGVITNNDARTLDVPLTFLPEGRPYLAYIYRDGNAPTRTGVSIERRTVYAAATLRETLKPGGGVAVRLTPAEP